MFRERYLRSNDRCNTEVTIKQKIILIKQAFSHCACTSVSRIACMHSIVFSVSLQNLFVIHLSLSVEMSGETTLANVHINTQITTTAMKWESKHTQLFNNVLSQAGGCVCLVMAVWVLQAVWAVPWWCMHTCHGSWLAVSQLRWRGEGGRGKGRVGQDGGREEGDRERGADALRAMLGGGRGRESKRARELYPLLMVVWCMEKEI